MSAHVDVIAVMTAAAKDMAGVAEAEGHYFDDADVNGMYEAIAAVADLIEALAEARAYVRMCTPAPDLPAEAWGYVMDRTGAALARCEGGTP